MFFASLIKVRQTLAFRLTLWYALLFILSAVILFVLSYMLIASVIEQRTDEDLLARHNTLTRIYALQGVDMLKRTAALQAQAAGEKKMFYRLFYKSGVVFFSSNMTYWKAIGIDRSAVESLLTGNRYVFTTQDMAGRSYPTRVIYARISSAIVVQMGYAMENEERMLLAFKHIFLTTISLLLILAVAGGWFMARRALAGVAMVTHTARQISEDDLQTRVPVSQRHNEIDRLAITFNQMLDRIQRLVLGTQQMNDNIAHDLRSTITRIRGLAEITLTNTEDLEEYRQMAASTIEESDRLLDMIHTMLTISRTEAGIHPTECTAVDLCAIVQDAYDLFQPLAEDKSIELKVQTDVNGDARVYGDQKLLQRMVANLVDNAIKYSDVDGRVTLGLDISQGRRLQLWVADTGIGIDPQDQPKIFHRFFRGDRSRHMVGSGLGLSFVQAVVRAHGGKIDVQSKLGEGSRFTIELPMMKIDEVS